MATLSPETGEYTGITGGGGYTTPPTTAPIPGSPGGTPWSGVTPVLKPTTTGAATTKSGKRCCGGGATTNPPPTGGGNIPGGGGGEPLIPFSGSSALRAQEEERGDKMNRNWLWLAVAAGVGYWLGKQNK